MKPIEILFLNLANLFKIKSLITLIVMIVFSILALSDKLPTEVTTNVVTAIITYFFTKQSEGRLINDK